MGSQKYQKTFRLSPVYPRARFIPGLLASWAASQIRVDSPMPSALLKGTAILLIYGGVLWLIDAHVRQLFVQVISSITQVTRGGREVESVDDRPFQGRVKAQQETEL
jgi:hypothetical protein